MKEVTVIFTSCNRVDLLEKTIDSFLKMNTYPIKEFHLHNDGPDKYLHKLKSKYQFINWHCSPARIGYSKSLDLLLSKVNTELVFTSEDDWLYYRNPGFIERSLKILEENSQLHQVWIRDQTDFQHPLDEEIEVSGIRVRPVKYGYHKHWNGFSLNPGLRRMSDLKTLFPNGLAEYGDEIILAQRSAEFNYRAVSMSDSTIKHIGWNRRSINFKP